LALKILIGAPPAPDGHYFQASFAVDIAKRDANAAAEVLVKDWKLFFTFPAD
jgi:hypothetical protein